MTMGAYSVSSRSVRLALFLLGLLSASLLSAQNRVDGIRARLLDPDDRTVLVAAHRGDWRFAPENSIESIDSAVELGIDIVELDVHKTLDGKLVLIHDNTLSRKTTGWGLVRLTPYSVIRRLRLKKDGKAVEGSRMPTLEEALLAAKGRIMVNLDKAFQYFDEVVEIARRTGTLDHIIFKSGSPAWEASKVLGDMKDSVIFMPVIWLDRPTAAERIMEYERLCSPAVYEFNFSSEADACLEVTKNYLAGKSRIWFNSLWASLCGPYHDKRSLEDPDAGYGVLINGFGASVLQTDQPDFLLEYLRSTGRH